MNLQAALRQPRLGRAALVAAGVVLLVTVVAVSAWAWYQSRESRGEAALAEASTLVQQASGPQATPEARDKAIAALEALIRDHPRFSGVPQAAYELAGLRYAAGQYGPARAAYELALAKGARGSVRTLCALGIGYTWEAEKNYANAVTAYQAVRQTMTGKDFAYEEALTALARAQQLNGQTAAAIDTYQQLLKEAPETRRADELRARVADLKSRSSQ